ncbi:hypothetical protein WN944_002890 [Citrus x changshan-huyou]|uniref:VAN3-binding protein n=1 Tax=Citrus x changshan-huyou TaxID=2935761 RepID=A0AAP0QNV5_9ROSI
MDTNFNPTPSEAHPETMDFLSRAWCNFAVQALQPAELQDRSIVPLDNSIKKFDQAETKVPFTKMDNSVKMDDTDFKSLPPWKSNDVKSWIWMQQAMHPELNYSSCLRKKWLPWKIKPFKIVSIKKWLREFKQKRKEEDRLQRAEVHAAISVAGIATALAAIAAENARRDDSSTTKEAAVASAAALVAAQCAKVAEGMGAKKEQLSSVISSAMSGTSASDILTFTAAATTSLKGAETLKARSRCKNILNGSTPVLPIEDNVNDLDFDFEKCRLLLAKGIELGIETSDGVILDLHAELYKDSDADVRETDTCYLLVLTTNLGTIKLDMGDDYQRYKMWATTINHMLMLSASFTKYELHYYKK